MGEVKVKNRKTMRLYGADYDREGIFFLTICTKNRKCILSRIVGTGVPDGPKSPTDIPEKQILVGTGVPDVPTVQNSTVSRFVSTFKRFSNKEYGENIWQYRSHDHIIRDREDHERHVGYILENPTHWSTDELYAEG